MPPTRRGPELCTYDDQDHARSGMVDVIEQAIEAEAQAQAICMQTADFERAYQRLRQQAEAGL